MKDEGVHKQLDSLFEALHNQYSISKLFVEGFCWGGNYALELAATDKVRLCSQLTLLSQLFVGHIHAAACCSIHRSGAPLCQPLKAPLVEAIKQLIAFLLACRPMQQWRCMISKVRLDDPIRQPTSSCPPAD